MSLTNLDNLVKTGQLKVATVARISERVIREIRCHTDPGLRLTPPSRLQN
jgi:hypothetical protein